MRRQDPGRGDPRGQWREVRRMRTLALLAVAAVLLGALPGFLLVRSAVRDPVFTALDSLRLPGWASRNPTSAATGNRWCLRSCRLRERLLDSERGTVETDQAYRAALRRAGWYPATDRGCPVPADGMYSCWQRDQYVLDLWTRVAVCSPAPTRLDLSPAPAWSAVPAPSAVPSGSAAPAGAGCGGARVTIKVTDRINPSWH